MLFHIESLHGGPAATVCSCHSVCTIWASGPLLASREDMAEVADAIEKVYENRDKLKSI